MSAKYNSCLSDFQIVNKIGEGAFSAVYKVIRKSDGLVYALKKVKIIQLKQKEKENALNEIRILASIDHPNIVAYKEAFIEGEDTLCIVMEFLAGGDLYQKIRECRKKKAHIPEALIWRYLGQLTKGLKHLHSMKIIHRDLKSANVFLSEDLRQIKLGDLNVSKVAKNRLVFTQTGTPYYASPEVWRDEPYDTKSDIWSLGCVAYEMCNRGPPFNAEKMEELFHKVQKGVFERVSTLYSSELNQIVSACLKVNPISRPSCDEILDNPLVKQFSRGSEEEIIGNQNPALLNTIRLTPNLKDLNDILPEPKYASDKKRARSVQNQRASIDVQNTKFNIQQRESVNNYNEVRNSRNGPDHPGSISLNRGDPAIYSPPVHITAVRKSSNHDQSSSNVIQAHINQSSSRRKEHENLPGNSDILLARIERLKRMAQPPASRERGSIKQSDSRLLNGSHCRRDQSTEINTSHARVRHSQADPIGPSLHLQVDKYVDANHKADVDLKPPSGYIRHRSPPLRDGSSSRRARLLGNPQPDYSAREELGVELPNPSSASKLKSVDEYQKQLLERVERQNKLNLKKKVLNIDDILAKQRDAELKTSNAPQQSGDKGSTVKKHPKVIGLMMGVHAAKADTVKKSPRPEISKNIYGNLKDDHHKVRRSQDLKIRPSYNNPKLTPSPGPGLRVSSKTGVQKKSSEPHLNYHPNKFIIPRSPRGVGQQGLEGFLFRRPSASNRQPSRGPIDEIDRLLHRESMERKGTPIDGAYQATGSTGTAARKKPMTAGDTQNKRKAYHPVSRPF